MYKMFKRYELPNSSWIKIKKKCEKLGIIFFSTPQNYSDLELLIRIGIPLIKVGSDDFNNLPMLEKFTNFNIPIIVSCGMSKKIEIQKTMSLLKRKKTKVILLLCTSEYPTPSENVNLMKLKTLQKLYPNLLLGFSDHTVGSLSACAALSFGACVFEKHFTLNNKDIGPDHWFSENPKNLKKWVDDIRETYKIFGDDKLKPTKLENEMRLIARRSIVASKDIEKNEKITAKNTCFKRPGDGMKPEDLKKIINLKAARLILNNEKIYLKLLKK
jgi:N,N'-diacetyllegionaminate synthase